jgi:hypothetical protein
MEKMRAILLRDDNVVWYETKRQSMWRCYLIGFIWKYMPDLTYKNREFIIVD